MRIGTNILALASQNQLRKTQAALGRALERLASGKRINSGKDDASGLARANGLDAQARGLARDILNVNDSMAVLQTADSAISTQMDILQRIRELAVQAANGTLGSKDRTSLNTEVQSLFDEYQRICRQTSFNGVQLLDGSFGTKSIQVGTRKGDVVDSSISSTQADQVMQKKAGVGTFNSQSTYSMGNFIGPVRIVDVDGDGYNDIASLDNTADLMNIRFGSSDGTFNTRKTFSVSAAAVSFEVGDLNNDGKIDFVTNDTTANTVTVNLNQGGRSFSSNSYATGANVCGVTIGDFDGDGLKDIATANWTSGTTSYINTFMNRGGGVFGTSVATTVFGVSLDGSNYETIQSGDMNGDGRADIVTGFRNTVTNRMAIVAYSRSSSGSLTQLSSNTIWQGTNPETYSGMGGLSLGDLNGDGKMDVLVSLAENFGTGPIFIVANMYTMLGVGDGTFSTTSTTEAASPIGEQIGGQVLGDINGDGRLDRLTSGNDPLGDILNYYQIGNGDGTFGAVNYLGTHTTRSFAPTVGDLNNDGINDILAGETFTGSAQMFYQDTRMASAVGDITVATQSSAKNLIAVIDTSIRNLNAIQSSLGAQQNRLEATANVNALIRENILSAQSNLMDTDVAEETANLVRSQILQQAQVSVLGQANLQLQMVLGLLKF